MNFKPLRPGILPGYMAAVAAARANNANNATNATPAQDCAAEAAALAR
jgi:hypothetical protein